ncbi:MAG TPA: macro domain-containing protein [Peptococcaceae bacterium]|nr:macro domain-containing protein [Peptococcaceae bacterium]
MPLEIVRNDITKMPVDVIVNAANPSLKMGGGVCGAIFRAAGAEQLQAECDKIGRCEVGQAVITGGYNLPAKYIIHTVGPIWQGGQAGEAELLQSCYRNSLALAQEKGCNSIAFPLISSGIYGYLKDQAFKVAVDAISEFLLTHELTVYLVIYERQSVFHGSKLLTAIGEYINENYAEEKLRDKTRSSLEPSDLEQFDGLLEYVPLSGYLVSDPKVQKMRSLEELVSNLEESFSEMLLRLIAEKGMSEVETYKRANLDRKLFSKIRNNKYYKPSKATAIALAIALRLNLNETLDLLSRAGYTLSPSSKFDLIIKYFLTNGIYNIYEINEALYAFGQELLGC